MIYTPPKRVPIALPEDEINMLLLSLELAGKVLHGEAHKVVINGLKERLERAKE